MGAWNTFSFENDAVYDAVDSTCVDEKRKKIEGCEAIAGGSTLFRKDNKEMTIRQAFGIVKPSLTGERYRKAVDYLDKDQKQDYTFAGVVLMGFGAGAAVPKKDACRAIDILEAERSVIKDGIKKLGLTQKDVNKRLSGDESHLVSGWVAPVSRVNRISEEIAFMNGKLKERNLRCG